MRLALGLLLLAAASPVLAQGHVHGFACGHHFTEFQGELDLSLRNLAYSAENFSSGGGMTIVLNDLGGVGVGTQARAGFEAAAALWTSVLKDPITIRLDVSFAALGAGILGSAGSTTNSVSYTGLAGLLAADAKSANDAKAVAALQSGPLAFVTNEPPVTGAIDSRLRFLDNDNTFDNNNIAANTAQLKALGVNPVYAANNPGGRDGTVQFSSAFDWDFDPSDGITPGFFDFVGVAAHEIGHVLGFRSGVDLADVNALPGRALPGTRGLGNIAWGTVNDLQRYGDFQGDRVLDWSIGGQSCFSIDGGANCLALLSTGRVNGDLRQASHWKDDVLLNASSQLGIMDPTASGPGGTQPAMRITALDLIAFDVMGYDIAAAVPEPASWAMLITGFGLTGAAMRRRRQNQRRLSAA